MRSLQDISGDFDDYMRILARQKQTAAALEEMYTNSPLYNIRFMAGMHLGHGKGSLSKSIDQWIPPIKSDLGSMCQGPEIMVEEFWEPQHGLDPGGGTKKTQHTGFYETVIDIKKRTERVKDLTDLLVLSGNKRVRRLLHATYWFNESEDAWKEAGRQLEYSKWSDLVRQNGVPVSAILFATACAVFAAYHIYVQLQHTGPF